jgi:hypothetical protein
MKLMLVLPVLPT